MQCDAMIRPFPSPVEVSCDQEENHTGTHQGTLRDYAYSGSVTVMTWFESDRRNFHGEWPGACEIEGCSLPSGHHGSHTVKF